MSVPGIYNDLGSGSNVDLCIISKGKVDYKRNVELLMGKTYTRQKPVRYAPGTSGEPICCLHAICSDMSDCLHDHTYMLASATGQHPAGLPP